MLNLKNSSAIVPCRDAAAAKRFYVDTLGLALAADHGEVFTLKTGSTFLNVYRTEAAGTNRANAVCWDCGAELVRIVAELGARGVRFEHYPDLPGLTLDGDVHRGPEGFEGAWFKDPDGNILHLTNM